MGVNDTMYGDNRLSRAHCWNLIFSIPLAPVMMFAVRVPERARSIMADHAYSMVN